MQHRRGRIPTLTDPNLQPATGAYYAAVMTDTPYAYWRFGEREGIYVRDWSGNGRHATYKESPTINAAGALTNDGNGSVLMNGTTQWIDIPDLSLSGDFSLEFLMNTPITLNNGHAVFGGDGGPNSDINFSSTTARLYYQPTDSDIVADTAAAGTNTWRHYVFTRSGTTVTLYRDGVSRATASSSLTFTFKGLGRSGGITGTNKTGYWPGYIDEVAVYTSALSGARVTAHYNAITA